MAKITSYRPAAAPRPAATPGPKDAPQVQAPKSTTASTPADQLAATRASAAEQQKIENFAQAQQKAVAKHSGAVDFHNLTQDQLYSYLQKLTVQQAAGDEQAWKTGEREVNLIGVRSAAEAGTGDGGAGVYRDTLFAARTIDGMKAVARFQGSVDGGEFEDPRVSGLGFYDRNGEYRGITQLADGFYRDAFKRATVSGGDLGLRQQGLVRLLAEQSDDEGVQVGEQLGGDGPGLIAGARHQIQFHRGAAADRVGTTSAGCQIVAPGDWERFQQVLSDAPSSQDSEDSGNGFSYLLIDGSKLPPVDGDFTALRRRDVDQRTAFQKQPGLWGARQEGDAPGPDTDGVEDREGGVGAPGFELRPDAQKNEKDGQRSRTDREGDGAGIVRTADQPSASFRTSKFSRWFNR